MAVEFAIAHAAVTAERWHDAGAVVGREAKLGFRGGLASRKAKAAARQAGLPDTAVAGWW